MDFKDYYATLGVAPTAAQADIKRAYRKLARKYHPDVSKERDAEARFKEVAEAHEALIDPERRAAYDATAARHARGEPFEPPPGWDSGFEYSGRGAPGRSGRQGRSPESDAEFSAFFESLFGRSDGRSSGHRNGRGAGPEPGGDHHARIEIDLLDAYRGASRTLSLRVPVVGADGRARLHERQLEVRIPRGVREGQQLRLKGQGAAGIDGAPAGDLYLEIRFLPHPQFRLDGADVFTVLLLSPWEAALGATVAAPTPEGAVDLKIPPGSAQGRKLRLKGRGLPGSPAGDLYAVLGIVLPLAATAPDQAAYAALATAFPAFNPRALPETPNP